MKGAPHSAERDREPKSSGKIPLFLVFSLFIVWIFTSLLRSGFGSVSSSFYLHPSFPGAAGGPGLVRDLIETITRVKDDTGESIKTAEETKRTAGVGYETVRDTQAAMKVLGRNSQATTSAIQSLNDNIMKINEIIRFQIKKNIVRATVASVGSSSSNM